MTTKKEGDSEEEGHVKLDLQVNVTFPIHRVQQEAIDFGIEILVFGMTLQTI